MNEQLNRILKHPATIPTLAGILSAGLGFTAGYFFGRRNKGTTVEIHDEPGQMNFDLHRSDFKSEVDQAIADADAFLEELDEKERLKERGGDIATPAEAFILEHLEGTVVLEEEPHPFEAAAQSIFAGPTNDWDYEEELKHRTTSAPYILHRDEFYAEEMSSQGYSQTTMTYYAGDNIMADQEEAPVYNWERITGSLRWGHGSGDPNVVHIRNDKRKEEYEVILDQGHYAQVVMGLDEEQSQAIDDIQHSGPLKFRPE